MNGEVRARLVEWLGELSSADARGVLECLVEGHQEIFDATDVRQDMFISHLVNNKGRVVDALRAVGVGYKEYQVWQKDAGFRGKLKIAGEGLIAELRDVAISKAMSGDGEMLKFLLSSLDPEVYDGKVRAQKVANEGQLEVVSAGMRSFTHAELRKLILEDPAQEFIPEEMRTEIVVPTIEVLSNHNSPPISDSVPIGEKQPSEISESRTGSNPDQASESKGESTPDEANETVEQRNPKPFNEPGKRINPAYESAPLPTSDPDLTSDLELEFPDF